MENNHENFYWLNQQSEQLWESQILNPHIYGFQIGAGTKWLPGLSQSEIVEFEQTRGFEFPQIYRDYLSCMNGTDKPGKNIYGSRTDIGHTFYPGFYSYPRDLEQIKENIRWIYEEFEVDEGFVQANKIPHIMPI